MTKKARAFLRTSIRERRRAHPKEPRKQSVAIGFAKARAKGFDLPRNDTKNGGPPKRDPPPSLPWPWTTIWPPRWHFGDWMEDYDPD